MRRLTNILHEMVELLSAEWDDEDLGGRHDSRQRQDLDPVNKGKDGPHEVKCSQTSQFTRRLMDMSEYALTPRSTSCSRLQKLCSSRQYIIRPRPNEGSMTFGVNSRTEYARVWTATIGQMTRHIV